jgi:hypothetical protein
MNQNIEVESWGEYKSNEFMSFFQMHGIKKKYIIANTPNKMG